MEQPKHIILFDGECNFCSFWVKYVIKRDGKDVFRFASLQSTVGIKYLDKFNISLATDSVVLIEQETTYIKSTAALRILKTLGGVQSIFYGLIIVPTFVRDFFYDLVAKHRYRWFGKTNCEFVAPQVFKSKFLM